MLVESLRWLNGSKYFLDHLSPRTLWHFDIHEHPVDEQYPRPVDIETMVCVCVCVVFCLPYFIHQQKTVYQNQVLGPRLILSLNTFPLRNGSLKNLEQKRQQLEALLQALGFGFWTGFLAMLIDRINRRIRSNCWNRRISTIMNH